MKDDVNINVEKINKKLLTIVINRLIIVVKSTKEVKNVDKYYFTLMIDDEKLKEIFSRLAKAEEEIQECYIELRKMNVIVLSSEKKAPL